MSSGPFKTGNEPTAVAIDPRGKFIYVTNSLDNSLSAYELTLATGVPTASVNATGSSNNGTSTQPVALAIDPALGRFVYTANYLYNSVSGFRLDPTSGSLTATQSTPYTTGNKPTAVVSIPGTATTLRRRLRRKIRSAPGKQKSPAFRLGFLLCRALREQRRILITSAPPSQSDTEPWLCVTEQD